MLVTGSFVLILAAGGVLLAWALESVSNGFRLRLADDLYAHVFPQTPVSGSRSPGTPLAGPQPVGAQSDPPSARRRVVWPPLPESGGHTTSHRGHAA